MRRCLVPLTVIAFAGCFEDDTREGCEEAQVYDHSTGACTAYTADDPVTAGDPNINPIWRPEPGTTWQWQLSGDIDTTRDVAMYDVDLADTPDAVFEALSDKVLICYFSAGSLETYRDDIGAIPDEAIGDGLDGWSDERWFDITHPAVRALVESRLDLAVERGCDGVEPDNVDGYANVSGFPLTYAEQLQFNRFIADEAHERGLSVGLKNDLGQLEDLEPWFDWAINEQCHQYEECGSYIAFRRVEKAIFHVEYVNSWNGAEALAEQVCGHDGFSTLVKLLDLGEEFLECSG